MLTGLGGRVMTYDGENRPLSVTVNNKRTCYVYDACGTRLKKIENLAANASCTALPATAVATVYFGAVEVRNWLVPGQEQVLTYPSPAVKLTNGVASFLHRDHLGSVRAITDASGVRVESAVYKPFGEQTEFVTPGLAAPESKGWIGERYDADAGLQYLNARYYDPVLGMFLQPDWFEVLKPGVGTNRFSYSFNDPVNKMDPTGHATVYGDPNKTGKNSYQGNVNPGDPGYGNIACGCGLGGRNPTATQWAGLNNALKGIGGGVQGFNGSLGTSVPASGGFLYQSDFSTSAGKFAQVRAVSLAGYVAIEAGANLFFTSDLGRETIKELLASKSIAKIDETAQNFRGPAFAETGKNFIGINFEVVGLYSFRTQSSSWIFGGPYEVAQIDVLIAHEIGHAVYGDSNEQNVVDVYENRYRLERGYALRDLYWDYIGPGGPGRP